MAKLIKQYLWPTVLALVVVFSMPSPYQKNYTFQQVIQNILDQPEIKDLHITIKYQNQIIGQDFLKNKTRRVLGLLQNSSFFIKNVNQQREDLRIKLTYQGRSIVSALSHEELKQDHSLQILLNLIDLEKDVNLKTI